MEYTITFLENDYAKLTNFLFSRPDVEQAAFILCNLSITERETRFLVNDVINIESNRLAWQKKDSLGIPSDVLASVFKRAAAEKKVIVFVHSHPKGYNDYSPIDDLEEYEIFRSAYIRIDSGIHASLLFPSEGVVKGRVWTSNLSTVDISKIRILDKNKYSIISKSNGKSQDFSVFDRQILAFGTSLQSLLNNIHIGVVGCGGTGSAIIEQLTRLGVGELTIIDHDTFELTNINRVHGSCIHDDGLPKIDIMENLINNIGLKTKVNKKKANIGKSLAAAKALQNCDVIFGCTDDNYGRFILNQIVNYYYIPVIDMGVEIDSYHHGEIKSIIGRVTKLLPDTACLLCRDRISLEKGRVELMSEQEAHALAKEGYAPGLNERAPAVICYTTSIASLAVNELIHLLSGYMGSDRTSSELITMFESPVIRTNDVPKKENCFFCSNDKKGKGDCNNHLGVSWGNEE